MKAADPTRRTPAGMTPANATTVKTTTSCGGATHQHRNRTVMTSATTRGEQPHNAAVSVPIDRLGEVGNTEERVVATPQAETGTTTTDEPRAPPIETVISQGRTICTITPAQERATPVLRGTPLEQPTMRPKIPDPVLRCLQAIDDTRMTTSQRTVTQESRPPTGMQEAQSSQSRGVRTTTTSTNAPTLPTIRHRAAMRRLDVNDPQTRTTHTPPTTAEGTVGNDRTEPDQFVSTDVATIPTNGKKSQTILITDDTRRANLTLQPLDDAPLEHRATTAKNICTKKGSSTETPNTQQDNLKCSRENF